MTPAKTQRQHQIEEIRATWERLEAEHRQEFPDAEPPAAVVAEPLPMFDALLREAEKRELSEIGWFDRQGRREARRRARAQAETQAGALLVDAQRDLDKRERLARERWQDLLDGEQTVVIDAVRATFERWGTPGSVAITEQGEVAVGLRVPGGEALPSHRPAVTNAGTPTLKKLNKTETAAKVRELVASRVLLATKQVLAASPATSDVVAEVYVGSGPCVMRARLNREAMARATWSHSAWDVLAAVDTNLETNIGGRTNALRAL